jgi:hypothetical protein
LSKLKGRDVLVPVKKELRIRVQRKKNSSSIQFIILVASRACRHRPAPTNQ